MFGKKTQEVAVPTTESVLVAQLNESVKTFVNAFLDAGLKLESGSLYDSAIPKQIVNGIISMIGAEMFIREGKRQHANEVAPIVPAPKKVARVVDTRTPQERAAALRKKQIEDNTAVFVE